MTNSASLTKYRWKSLKNLLLDKLALHNPEFNPYKNLIRTFRLRKDSETSYTIDFSQSGVRVRYPALVTITFNKFTLENLFINILGVSSNRFNKNNKQELLDIIPDDTNSVYDDQSDSIIISPYRSFNIGETILVNDNTPTYALLSEEYRIPLLVTDKVDLISLSTNDHLAISVFDYIEPRDDI